MMQIRSGVTLTVLSLLVAQLVAQPIQAANFIVTNTSVAGAGSLQQAILDANASSDSGNSITMAHGLSGTISPGLLRRDLPLISSTQLTINGSGARLLTLDLSGSQQRLSLASGVSLLAIQDIAISGGSGVRGGCLNSEHGAELRLIRVRFENCTTGSNSASENARGGAVYSSGNTLIEDSSFLSNKALGDTVAGAEGGAIHLAPLVQDTLLTIRRSLLTGNEASSSKDNASVLGGGVRLLGNVHALIEDSGFTSNRTTLTGTGSSGGGGAIGGVFGALTLRRNLFYMNSSSGSGSALYFSAFYPDDRPPTGIENNSFLENTGNLNGVVNSGAAIFIYRSALRLRNNGFRNNHAGPPASSVPYAGSLHYGGEIDLIAVANNAFDVDDQKGAPSCYISYGVSPDAYFAGSHNYFTDDSCTWLARAGSQHPSLNLDATTMPPGATTFALMPKWPSPLIDGGTDGQSYIDWSLCPTNDQVGSPRPQDNDGNGVARCTAGPTENADMQWMVVFSDGFED